MGTSGRVVVPWSWNRRFSARCNRQRTLLTSNAKPDKTRSAAVGRETSSPVISVDLIDAGYGGTVPKTLRLTPEYFLPERSVSASAGPGSWRPSTTDSGGPVNSRMIWASLAGWSRGMSV